MAEKKKAKFSVGQVVALIGGDSYGRVVKVLGGTRNRVLFPYYGSGQGSEEDCLSDVLRPLTSREIGPRPRPQPTKRGR